MSTTQKLQSADSLPRRTPQGTLIRPRQQLRYAMMMICGGILVQTFLTAFVAYFINRSVTEITIIHGMDPNVSATITHSIIQAMVTMMVVACALGTGAILIGVKLSHRIYGPMIPFTRHIEELKAGNYTSRIRLRKTDDLVEIQEALNDLAESLEHKHRTHGT